MRPFLPVLAACLCSPSVQAGLVIYYPLDETIGNVAFDAAIADGSQDATASVVASDWQAAGGIIGGGLRFSPTSQPDVDEALIYNTASTSTSILGAHPFTISLWFNTTHTTAFTQAGVFLGNSTQSAMYYAVSLAPNTYFPIQVARNTTAQTTTASAAANDGQWHQLTAVFTAPDSRTFYVDGRLAGTNTASVTHPILNRFGVGALTRSNQTDSFNGILDEVGLFDTAFSAQEAALLNAFPRYDPIRLDGPEYGLALSVFNAQSGAVDTGDWTWTYATGLSGTIGDTGSTDGNPYVVLDASGNGLAAIPEPGVGVLAFAGLVPLMRRRR